MVDDRGLNGLTGGPSALIPHPPQVAAELGGLVPADLSAVRRVLANLRCS